MTMPPSNPPSAPPPPAGQVPPPLNYLTPGSIPADPADVAANKVYAVLAYLGILVLVPILAAPNSRFARYHANQGLILLLTKMASVFFLVIPAFFLAIIPLVGPCLVCLLIPLIIGSLLTLIIVGIIHAANGEMKPLPVIGQLFTLIR